MRTMKTAMFGGLAALLVLASAGLADDPAPANAGTITGKVTGPDGKAVAKAVVHLRADTAKTAGAPAADAPKPKKNADKGVTATTDDNGAFKFDNVAAGSYSLVAEVKGQLHGKATTTVEAGKTVDVSIAMTAIKNKKA